MKKSAQTDIVVEPRPKLLSPLIAFEDVKRINMPRLLGERRKKRQ